MSKEQWLKDRERLWEEVFEDGTHCEGCEFKEVTEDPYSTGDSPAIRECNSYSEKCPGVDEDWVDGMYS
jgi:hypothetical protein